MKSLRLLNLAILALTISMASCTGEDGTNGLDGSDGTNGINGTNGENGADGADGADGENGVGFDELIKFGSVTMKMEGTRPDNIAFTDSTSFKFFPVGGDFLQDFEFPTNSVFVSEQGTDTFHEFGMVRFLSAPDDIYQDTSLALFLVVKNLGQPTQSIEFAYMSIVNYSVIGDDNMYFVMNDEFATEIIEDPEEPEEELRLADFEFSNIAYDDATQNLTFSYSLSVPGLNDGTFNNDTGNDLTISGTADVNLLEAIITP